MYSWSSLAGLVSSKRRLQLTAEFLRQAEVQADRLGVADMQVAVGLRREAGDDLGMHAGVQVGLDDRTEEIRGGGSLGLAHGILAHDCCAARVGRAK